MQKNSTSRIRLARVALLAAVTLPALTLHALSDDGTRDLDATGTRIAADPADPKIQAALQTISPDAIRNDIATLVTFKNRSTLSSMTPNLPPSTGVSAAADDPPRKTQPSEIGNFAL